MNRTIAIVLVLAAAVGAAYLTGRVHGKAALQARLDAAVIEAQSTALEASKAIAAAEQSRRALSQQLEDAANAQPVASPACLPADRVRRINLR